MTIIWGVTTFPSNFCVFFCKKKERRFPRLAFEQSNVAFKLTYLIHRLSTKSMQGGFQANLDWRVLLPTSITEPISAYTWMSDFFRYIGKLRVFGGRDALHSFYLKQ